MPVSKTKLLLISITTSLLPNLSHALTATDIEGFWAMSPLNNGIANVIHFDKKGSFTVFPFECNESGGGAKPDTPEKYEYKISGNSIHLFMDGKADGEIKVQSLTKSAMTATQVNVGLTFKYTKVKEAQPLCPK